MAPPRKHETDAILDATRTLVLADGPRAASVAAIAKASGAPAGTLYHRFGNRDGILAATWLRALDRFQARAMGPAMGADRSGALDTAVAMGVAAVTFAGECPDDARLLLAVRPGDLLDGTADLDLAAVIAERNAPLLGRVTELAERLYGDTGPRAVDAVTRAIVDRPYTVVRRHAAQRALPAWLAGDVADAIRALLTAYRA